MKEYTEVSLFDISDTFPDEERNPFPQSMIDQELIRGSGFEDGKYRIYKWFNEGHTEQQNRKFLAREYGLGGWSTDFGYLDHSSKGLEFRIHELGKNFDDDKIKIMSWAAVSQRLQVLIALNKYLNEDELKYYEENKEEIDIWWAKEILDNKESDIKEEFEEDMELEMEEDEMEMF